MNVYYIFLPSSALHSVFRDTTTQFFVHVFTAQTSLVYFPVYPNTYYISR